MFNFREIQQLLIKDFTLEIRSKAILASTFLYVFSTVFICYLSFRNIDLQVWNSMLWVVVLFALTNAANRIFTNESGKQKYYLYTLANPRSVILSKLIYQWIISCSTAILVFLSWSLLFQYEIAHPFYFMVIMLLGVTAMSNILTLNNSLSSSTENSPATLAILSFPLLVPVLMATIEATRRSLMIELDDRLVVFILVLGLLNVLSIALSYILFPYLWRH